MARTGTPTGTAAPRSWDFQGETIAQWLDKRYQDDPQGFLSANGGALPNGTHLEDGHLVADTPGMLLSHPWLIPLIGATAGAAGAAAGGLSGLGSAMASTGAAGGGGAAAAGGAAAGGAMPSWLGPVIGAGSNLIGALIQSNATGNASQLNAAAVAAALKFQEQQAALGQANSEITRQANYGQWAAREGRISDYGSSMLGLAPRNIPAYVPGAMLDPSGKIVPYQGPTGTGASSTGQSSGSSANPQDRNAIQQALTQHYQSLGVQPTGRGTGPTDIAYYADQIANTGGLTPQNSAYWFGPNGSGGRIASDLHGSGQTSGAQSLGRNWYSPTQGNMGAPGFTPPIAPGVQMPQPYIGTGAGMLNG